MDRLYHPFPEHGNGHLESLPAHCATAIQKGHGFVLLDANEAAPERSRQPHCAVRHGPSHSRAWKAKRPILCDIASLGDDEQQSLLYVGMSRARLQVTLILKSDLREAFDECRAKQFSAEWK